MIIDASTFEKSRASAIYALTEIQFKNKLSDFLKKFILT